jgi:two-component system sensor histidine kinase KdpD
VHDRTAAARLREHEVARLYSLVRELADADSEPQIARVLVAHLRDAVGGGLVVLLPAADVLADPGCVAASDGVPDWLGPAEFGLAKWCFDRGLAAGAGTGHLPGSRALFLPMAGRRGCVGVFGWYASGAARSLSARDRSLVAMALGQAAAAIERLHAQAAARRERQTADVERLRSTLLQSVSHDLRTPLASITGAASSLLDDGAPLPAAARHELLAGIVQESRRLDELIANLLTATRLEAGEVVLQRVWTSLEETVGAALRRARSQLGTRPVAVRVDPGLPLVEADPVLAEQLVFLLLDNVARHTGPEVAVDVHVFHGGGRAGVEVADRGAGIAPDLRGRLFTRFERGARSGGLGLGLAIGAAIARAHGGQLELVGERAVGAAFRFTLPAPRHQPRPPAETGR